MSRFVRASPVSASISVALRLRVGVHTVIPHGRAPIFMCFGMGKWVTDTRIVHINTWSMQPHMRFWSDEKQVIRGAYHILVALTSMKMTLGIPRLQDRCDSTCKSCWCLTSRNGYTSFYRHTMIGGRYEPSQSNVRNGTTPRGCCNVIIFQGLISAELAAA